VRRLSRHPPYGGCEISCGKLVLVRLKDLVRLRCSAQWGQRGSFEDDRRGVSCALQKLLGSLQALNLPFNFKDYLFHSFPFVMSRSSGTAVCGAISSLYHFSRRMWPI
jgi:hypothetical protein